MTLQLIGFQVLALPLLLDGLLLLLAVSGFHPHRTPLERSLFRGIWPLGGMCHLCLETPETCFWGSRTLGFLMSQGPVVTCARR